MAAIQTDPQYKLRLPPELKELVERAAKANNRSMNAEIIARLQKTFGNSDEMPEFSADLLYTVAQAAAEETTNRLLEIFVDNIEKQAGEGTFKQIDNLKRDLIKRMLKRIDRSIELQESAPNEDAAPAASDPPIARRKSKRALDL